MLPNNCIGILNENPNARSGKYKISTEKGATEVRTMIFSRYFNPFHTRTVRSSLHWVYTLEARSLNLVNDKPLKPEILHTLKATQNVSFQVIIVNIKDYSMAR